MLKMSRASRSSITRLLLHGEVDLCPVEEVVDVVVDLLQGEAQCEVEAVAETLAAGEAADNAVEGGAGEIGKRCVQYLIVFSSII